MNSGKYDESGNIGKMTGYLKTLVTPHRLGRFEQILQFRTRHLTVVLEDIFQPHNASAVLRSCDCFGLQDVHIIENRNIYRVNPDVALGAYKWLTIQKYNSTGDNTATCLTTLKEKGYRIVATTPHTDSHTPDTLPLYQKTALVFGTELEGLSRTALELADDYVKIPMYGFTESLNISVSAAILMQALTSRLRQNHGKWELTESEKEQIMLQWLMATVNNSDIILREMVNRGQSHLSSENEHLIT